MSDLLKFVNVALATAAGGEGDLANDRLSNLSTVGSGFSSLIYKLHPNTGFRDLHKICKSVFENRSLPHILVRSLLLKDQY